MSAAVSSFNQLLNLRPEFDQELQPAWPRLGFRAAWIDSTAAFYVTSTIDGSLADRTARCSSTRRGRRSPLPGPQRIHPSLHSCVKRPRMASPTSGSACGTKAWAVGTTFDPVR